MKKKSVLCVFGLVLLEALFGLSQEPGTEQRPTLEASSSSGHVIVYYFYGNHRCTTCRTLEKLSKEAIFEGFSKEIDAGTLAWRPVNTDEPENKHFVDEFKLFTKSLVVVRTEDGETQEWKNCQKIWELVRNPDEFKRYVTSEIRAFLERGG